LNLVRLPRVRVPYRRHADDLPVDHPDTIAVREISRVGHAVIGTGIEPTPGRQSPAMERCVHQPYPVQDDFPAREPACRRVARISLALESTPVS
jgi:hypothetical protein